ncbi:DC1, C1-like, Zinc finger, RING/FYVE/PHD-type [Artemisia annua]|uniref:DC1, C1-like, Zinc finger, RING/FYVE/PHD-type n=1 Tax=Artemisia annua TaxID=35608 RepID=A0A2U1NT48_ARTAN|nr:DC1, C1-like, Zinc finger, RING/FYVE/PHD-type [Artemisia annua]
MGTYSICNLPVQFEDINYNTARVFIQIQSKTSYNDPIGVNPCFVVKCLTVMQMVANLERIRTMLEEETGTMSSGTNAQGVAQISSGISVLNLGQSSVVISSPAPAVTTVPRPERKANSGQYYHKCDQCQYSIHKFCAELPETLQHHSHVCRRHHLILQRYEFFWMSWNCHICGTIHKKHELLYRCPECYFYLDLHCATRYLKTNIIQHPSHLHPLVCLVEEILCKCHACGKKHEGIFYHCATCPFPLLHSDCAFLPKTLSIQQTTNDIFSHPHPLTLAYSLVIEDRKTRSYVRCRVCNRRFDWHNESLWIYKCDRCRYYAHLDCATARHEPFMSILMSPGMGRLLKNFKDDDYPDLVHLPFPDQTMNLIKHLFSKEIECSTSETKEAKQARISHQHPLVLVDTTKPTSSTLSCHDPMKKVELICNGCVRTIMDSPFYTCADEDERCSFVLHEWCTRLPAELENHPGHLQHTLVFMPKVPYKPFGVFECDVCKFNCNGFVYCCIECEYNVDVCCAFIPDKITHKAHPNHLLSRVTKRLLGDDRCRLCFWTFYSDSFTFSCQDCGFHIHPGCALLLSETIRHKYDKHPLHLSYLPIENHKGDYFCDICEEQFWPERVGCFYHCEKCAQSMMHPACSMPIVHHKNPIPLWYLESGYQAVVHLYVNIKFGGRLKSESHPHPLSLVQGLKSDGRCPKCGRELDFQMILKCLESTRVSPRLKERNIEIKEENSDETTVRDDVIRFRYGDEQHLDEALKRIFHGPLSSHLYMNLVQATLVHQFTFNIDSRNILEVGHQGVTIGHSGKANLELSKNRKVVDGSRASVCYNRASVCCNKASVSWTKLNRSIRYPNKPCWTTMAYIHLICNEKYSLSLRPVACLVIYSEVLNYLKPLSWLVLVLGHIFSNSLASLNLKFCCRHFGDTGFLDHILKHVANEVNPRGTLRF